MHVRRLSEQEHQDAIRSYDSASFLQCPSWGRVKLGWSSESLGWIGGGGEIVGTALVLYRKVPALKRFFAYIPEGPLVDWYGGDLASWHDPLLEHLRERRVFSVKMGPPVPVRRWLVDTVKEGLASPSIQRLGEMAPDIVEGPALEVGAQLRDLGWQPNEGGTRGFGGYQPRFVFHIPLAGRSLEEIRSGLNASWRRNIAKAAKAGVEVCEGSYDDLPLFHALLEVTAKRDGFTARPLWYYERQFRELTAEEPDRMRLFLARHRGEVLAAATMLRVGKHVWFQSGGSADHRREVRPSNAIQWRMIQEAHALGAAVYDMRGISETLDEQHPMVGLTRFKVGTGGQAVENLGEWDMPLNRPLHRGFTFYLTRRPSLVG